MELAGVRGRPPAVQPRGRPVPRRATPRRRRRRNGGRAGARPAGRHSRVRRQRADERPHGHDPHRRRLLGHTRPSRLAGREEERAGGGGRSRGRARHVGRGGVAGAVRPPRRSPDDRSERLPRPVAVPPGAAGAGRACAHARTGAARRRPEAGGNAGACSGIGSAAEADAVAVCAPHRGGAGAGRAPGDAAGAGDPGGGARPGRAGDTCCRAHPDHVGRRRHGRPWPDDRGRDAAARSNAGSRAPCKVDGAADPLDRRGEAHGRRAAASGRGARDRAAGDACGSSASDSPQIDSGGPGRPRSGEAVRRATPLACPAQGRSPVPAPGHAPRPACIAAEAVRAAHAARRSRLRTRARCADPATAARLGAGSGATTGTYHPK
jgi:hypothetical protein